MMKVVENNVLVVPPFDCAWLADVRFPEPGRGCVSFEARSENDVTIIFKELAGCKHYRTDSDPNYTIIIGSNLNKRLKIEANGSTVVDSPGPVVSSLSFEKFWISIDEGIILVGRGDPGRNVVSRWADPHPNLKVEFVGLSSWDKHVGYRNVVVMEPPRCFPGDGASATDAQWSMGVASYLESEALADFHFVLAREGMKRVPAHRPLLVASSSSSVTASIYSESHLELECVDYGVLHSALSFVYTGTTEIDAERLGDLHDLAELLGVESLASQCRKVMQNNLSSNKLISLVFSRPSSDKNSPALPVSTGALTRMLSTGEFSDLELLLEDHEITLHLHRLVLSVWSAPFAKMFTSGMKESRRTQVTIGDVHLDAFMTMIRFMYNGRLELDENVDPGSLLLPLLVLSDRYGVHLLQQQCEDLLHACVNEDSSCAILQVASSIPFCETLRQACEECCAKHFDYCLSASAAEFRELDARTVLRILQHPDLLVTSEERLLDAVLMWCARTEEFDGWSAIEKRLRAGSVVSMHDRDEDLKVLLPLVRFPLMSMNLLEQFNSSVLCAHMPFLRELVQEAMQYQIQQAISSDDQKDSSRIANHGRLIWLPKNPQWFTRRLSSYKELLYISDGDCNGVFYYAGTSFGAHPWMNPVLVKKLTLSSSSPVGRYTDPKALVSRNYQATSFAGPCIEAGRTVSWWKVDLGASHELMCNYYSVRQDGSTHFARSWVFQGSGDGEKWTDLRRHEKDYTICRPGQYASWPVYGAKALMPFRYFRVLLTMPTEGASSSLWSLCICYLELYGYLH